MKVDVILGLQYGDEAKAKCAYNIVKDGFYDYTVRFNGGPNAGHTLYHNGEKFVTHQVPIGVFFNIKSIIGPCSVVDLNKLEKEVQEINEFLKTDISDLLYIDKRTHIITEFHVKSDSTGSGIGSTRSGIAYAYADKHLRTGTRYSDNTEKPFKEIDITEILKKEGSVLFEGAQGVGLDIDFGDYPFVTSSHCTIAGVIASGVRPDQIRDVIGCAKIYETYVGTKKFQDLEDDYLTQLQNIGLEIGATTGRKRQCNYLNLNMLINNVFQNQVNTLIINKTDVVEEVGIFRCIHNNEILNFENLNQLKRYVSSAFDDDNIKVIFSDNPYTI